MSNISDPVTEALFDYVLRLGDSSLILAQRLSQWSAHAPTIEEDIALSNIALDLLGQARALLNYAGEVEGQGRDEDALAYHRDSAQWRNLLLVEQDNGDFAHTMVRQFFYDVFSLEFHRALANSKDARLAAIAGKAIKETTYHRRHSSSWVIRLGDGTEQSQQRMQRALESLWTYTGELFEMTATDELLLEAGIGVDLLSLRPLWDQVVDEVLQQAQLTRPEDSWMAEGGKHGLHTEQFSYLLAELQFLQRTHPGVQW